MASESKNPRLVARVPEEIHSMVATAAKLSGLKPTQFVIQAVTDAAQRVITEARQIELSTQDAERIAELLANPGQPNRSLIEAAKRYKDKDLYDREIHHNGVNKAT